MKLLKTGLVAICVISLAASCSTYKSCPAYATEDSIQKKQMIQVLNAAEAKGKQASKRL
ncbi:hypothetical protein [Catalinimonas alkaloidigena]|uniref:hypothetical protein n=1 Tax=Catalinimonas alkaloidigena TaxID=1075417 RepID=UPI002404FF33|nr:hypothetical protein [Catalinimonas alkaloidigena]